MEGHYWALPGYFQQAAKLPSSYMLFLLVLLSYGLKKAPRSIYVPGEGRKVRALNVPIMPSQTRTPGKNSA